MNHLTEKQKFQIVIDKNTFFFQNREFEEYFESYISSLAQLLLLLKTEIEEAENNSKKKEVIVNFIRENPDGLTALLTLLGFSKESLLRLVTFIRICNDETLDRLVNKNVWPRGEFTGEWSKDYIIKLIRENQKFAEGIVNLFFKGATVPILRNTIPLFEFKKLDFTKLDFSIESLIDTLIRYKTKGSYSAREENNPTKLITSLLTENKIPFVKNKKIKYLRRNIDFAIPNEINPKVIIESSYEVTTASGMGDKAKTEIEVAGDIKKYYPKTIFIGFVDGVGWYVRRGDLKRLVSAFQNVFTFKESEIERFLKFIKSQIK